MRRPEWITSIWPSKAGGTSRTESWRDRFARHVGLATLVCLCTVFLISKGTQFLMPGPLTSAHGAIETCSTCHTKSGSGKLSWVHGLIGGDPLADSKACLTCHKMPETAFNAHGASSEVLERSTERLTKIASRFPQPPSARAQTIAFPTHDMAARGLSCATCHQEHQGVNFNLKKISNEQCRSCHVVKFDSFDGHHPDFVDYPFNRRTRIVYDHAAHFGKHFPEVAKKDQAKRIPETCSSCHNSRDDKRIMGVARFEQTCSACHLGQIIGKERVSGPKGIAFLTLPGIDVQTLKKKKAAIGEWPDGSEAELTPFMKFMISRNEPGRALIKSVDGLNLQDLSGANDDQIKSVTGLVWEIKQLLYALISGKASDVLADIDIGDGVKLDAKATADLTASIPRDVVISAQQEWLPNLAEEMLNRQTTSERKQSGSTLLTTQSIADRSASSGSIGSEADPSLSTTGANREATGTAEPMRLAQVKTHSAEPDDATPTADVPRDAKPDQGIESPSDGAGGGPIIGRRALPSGTPRSIRARNEDTGKAKSEGTGGKIQPAKAARPDEGAGKAETAPAQPDDDKKAPSADESPEGKPTAQSDDLLAPTEAELAEIKAREKGAPPERSAGETEAAPSKPDGTASADAATKAGADAPASTPATPDRAAAKPQPAAMPASSIGSDLDAESWAEDGGWYRQDYAIFYRPTGHKDKFIYSWLVLTGPQARKGDASPATAVFDFLTGKDAQGACTKCHSVDDVANKGRLVNFSSPSFKSRQGRFTSFVHEPHFGVLETRGCLACHSLEKDRPYLKSYEQGNPQSFASNFGAVKKTLCATCHTASMARQDCVMCHKYHVNGVITPIMKTKIPTQ